MRSFKGGNDLDVGSDAQARGLLRAIRTEVNVVILVVRQVVNGKKSAMQIQEGQVTQKSEGSSRCGGDDDLAGHATIPAFRSKLYVHQRSCFYLLERGGSCAAADARFFINAEMHRHGVDAVTQRDLAVSCINGHDLPVGVRRRSVYAHADVAGKNVMARSVQHGINIDPLPLFKGEVCGLRAMAKDVRAFIEKYGPASATKHRHSHAVAHVVHITDDSTNQSRIA